MWENDKPGNYDIFYKRSSDRGTTWSGITRLTWNSGGSHLPSMSTDSGSGIYVVWVDGLNTGDMKIYFKESSDSGITWSVRKRLTWTAIRSNNPSIVTDSSDGLHVVCIGVTTGDAEIFCKTASEN